MLKEIIGLWKGESFMKGVIEEFEKMLEDAEYIFNHAWETLIGKLTIEEVKNDLYERDRAINRREREIRKMLIEHLSINPRQDTSGCLAFMSIIKDAERLGDHSKNIFDLAVIMKGEAGKMKYIGRVSKLRDRISARFPLLKKAFLEPNENLAKEILKEYESVKSGCNKVLEELFLEELSTKEAVCTALLSRYLKRMNSHMSNIASGIIYPLDEIDFVRGDLLE
jgi:phosphate uptake regulator